MMKQRLNFNSDALLALPHTGRFFNSSLPQRQDKKLFNNRGFTLLEVMLALGLSIVVITAIGSAITMYFRIFDSGRTNIEEAQLARALLRRMADDIRGTVLHNAVDMSKLVPQTSGSTTGTSTTSGTNGAASTGGASQSNSASAGVSANVSLQDGSTSDNSGTEASTTDDTTDLSTSALQTIPGLYGNSTQLQIDVSRLPRIDQYMQSADQGVASSTNSTTGSMFADHLSDLRNIAYYIFGDTTSPVSGAGTGLQMGCGLVRRDMDRASELFASQSGLETNQNASEDVIASEVEAIQFSYYDGYTWYDTWDSTQNDGLPLAVQITLSISRPAKKSGEIPVPGVYSLIVNLPTAKSSSTTDTSSSSSTSSDSQSTSVSK
jgi:type II secretory pathway pseudopilin PulG